MSSRRMPSIALAIATSTLVPIAPLAAQDVVLDVPAPTLEAPVIGAPPVSAPAVIAPPDDAVAPSAPAPLHLRLLEPTRHGTGRTTDAGTLFLATLAGDLIGAGVGAAVALLATAFVPCRANGSWLDGYTCGSAYGFSAALGAMIGAPLGGAISLARATGARHDTGNGWAGLGGALVGIAAGVGLASALGASTDQLTLSFGIGGAIGLATSLALTPIFYAVSRPSRGPNVAATATSILITF